MDFKLSEHTGQYDCMYCRNRRESKNFIAYLQKHGKGKNFRPQRIGGRTFLFNYGTFYDNCYYLSTLKSFDEFNLLVYDDFDWSDNV